MVVGHLEGSCRAEGRVGNRVPVVVLLLVLVLPGVRGIDVLRDKGVSGALIDLVDDRSSFKSVWEGVLGRSRCGVWMTSD